MLIWTLVVSILSVNSLFGSFVVTKNIYEQWRVQCSNIVQEIHADQGKGSVLFVVSDELAFYTNDWILLPENKSKFNSTYEKNINYYNCLENNMSTAFIQLLSKKIAEGASGHLALNGDVSPEIWACYQKLMNANGIWPNMYSMFNNINLRDYKFVIIFAREKSDGDFLRKRLGQYPEEKIKIIHFEDKKPTCDKEKHNSDSKQSEPMKRNFSFERTLSWVSFYPITESDWEEGKKSTDEPAQELNYKDSYLKDEKECLADVLAASWDGTERFMLLI